MALLQLKSLQAGALPPVDLNLEAEQCLCLSGPSGVGKSRLLRAIADLDPHEGEALLDGQATEAYTPCQWRQQVGMLAAESAWWADTVGEHFPHDVKQSWLQELGFTAEVMQWQVSRCSTGEKQRLALIRLLCNRPRVLLLDEPTASLDPGNVGKAEQLLKEYLQTNSAVAIWVSHDPEQIKRVANRHLVIEAEKIWEQAL